MNPKYIVLFSIIASLIRKLSLPLLLVGCFFLPTRVAQSATNKPSILSVEDNGEQVSIQVQVKGEGNRPINDLSKEDFKFEVLDPKTRKIYKNLDFDWQSPREVTPPPVFIVVLLDVSGSMKCSQDLTKKCVGSYASKGNRKIDAAIQALNKFLSLGSKRKGDTKVSIVPFGLKKDNVLSCNYPEPVDETALDNFLSIQDVKLTGFLSSIADKDLCASTNLYQPIQEALQFFTKDRDPRFYPLDKDGNLIQPQPRLAIILLSDGYDNQTSKKYIDNTLADLKNHKEIVVHTLGYGLTLKELGVKYVLGRDAKSSDINSPKLSQADREALEKEFVEPEPLQKIAFSTGGITDFAGDADQIAKKLENFLDAILGRYQITYTQPNADREKKIDVRVFAQNVPSEFKPCMMKGFGRPVSGKFRLIIFIGTVFTLSAGGILPYYLWGKKLKNEG